MPKHEFKAVVLDLFDTLVKWEPERLPLMEWQGRTFHSTMPWVLPELERHFGKTFDRDAFIHVYNLVIEEIGLERERDDIEVTCTERFTRTLTRFRPGPEDDVRAFAEHLTRVHMERVRAVTWAPEGRTAAVRRMAPHYRLGLLSNFDDAFTGRAVLNDTGVATLFEAVIISAEVRLRKPNPRIYSAICTMLQLAPREMLFVGDTPREDVAGPKGAGMYTAWVSKGAPSVPEGIPRPDFMINDLSELPAVLGV
ncbi:MAG: HAD family hydrolase [Candidatus Binataceae bacterium]